MTTAQLIVVDLGIAACTGCLWLTASLLLSGRRHPLSHSRARLALLCMALAAAQFIAQIEFAMVLGETGWRFAQEKLVFCLPTGAVTTVLAVAIATPAVVAAATASTDARATVTPLAPTALMVAATTSAAGIAARVVIGFPITPLPAAVLVALVGLVGWVTFVVVSRRV